MTVYFVTGTDTGVGKTVVVAAVAAIHCGRGRRVAVIKPAQTGVGADEPGDADEAKRLAGQIDTVEGIRLADPLAADRAARVAGVGLPALAAQRDLVLQSAATHDIVLVEGSGGVAVNLGDSFTLLDIADQVMAAGAPVVWLVVTRAGLGTLNHSRLTVGAIRDRGRRMGGPAMGGPVIGDPVIGGLVIGAWPANPTAVDLYNRTDLPRYTGVAVVGAIPEGVGQLPPERFRSEAPGWLPGLQD